MYDSTQAAKTYFPPMLGNGDVTFRPDAEGGLGYSAKDFPINSVSDGAVFRAGRRAASTKSALGAPYPLTSLGRFFFDTGSLPLHFTQELHIDKGMTSAEVTYENGARVRTECLLMQDRNLWVIRKTADRRLPLTFTYAFRGYTHDVDRGMRPPVVTQTENRVLLDFEIWGFEEYHGRIAIACSAPFSCETEEKDTRLSLTLEENVPVCFYMATEDDLFSEDPKAVAEGLVKEGEKTGFSALVEENTAVWEAYYRGGFVKTEDEKLNAVYKTALYHVKSYATRWSLPVAIDPGSWHGKFFAFDEFFAFHGILGAGMTEIAERVPRFRLQHSLGRAIFHATSGNGEKMAHFPWQTLECGDECATMGHWNDHIFHMATIALETYEYYEHTEDVAYLEEHYPLLRAVAKFYTMHSIYKREDGSFYVGKCTDLERLGPAKENPLFTLSGVIKSLEIYALAAERLGVDEEYRGECLAIANGLRQNIPTEDGRVVPFLACPQRSIAVFTPKFPFDVLPKDDPRLLPAWQDYMASETSFGNMYIGGKGVNPWYAFWKATAFARMGMSELAHQSLKQGLRAAGEFNELFEINEPDVRFRPWFTTAAGVCLSAVTEMLLESDGQVIRICPAFDGDVSFRLSAKGGVTVEATAKGGRLEYVRLIPKKGVAPRAYHLYFKEQDLGEILSK
ncbi:MAG: hypothetical protein J6R89_08195 [Clostridia bacterium]|nr:hypothetical protein [Clostridia bacterium]